MRITNEDDILMNPENQGKELTAEEIEDQFSKRVTTLTEAYKLQGNDSTIPIETTKIAEGRVFQTNFWTQFTLLFYRSLLNSFRSPMEYRMKIFQALFLSITSVIVFQNLGAEVSGIQNRNGVLFLLCVGLIFGALQGAIGTFSTERALFLRERLNKQYTVSAYFWGRSLSDIPFHIITPMIELSIIYFGTGLSTSLPEKYWIAALTAITCYFTGTSYGLFLSVAIPKQEVATALVPVVMIPLMAFGGFFVNQNKIPVFFYPIQYISPFKYAYQVLTQNEFTDNTTLKCLISNPPTCNPLADHNFREGMWLSLILLFVIGLAVRIFSVILMYKISTPTRVKMMIPQQNGKQKPALQP
eukprot:TRINITY_DN5697_c0_g2_i1.p1 TRINITY_DN5697_c0_g2~~TRINITY_DN5697_c0_g2_i1.p1  ORF type:complete len:357 (-),score=45.35 TRINITY_DN5697_c0_g2_i1:26-1096(-)